MTNALWTLVGVPFLVGGVLVILLIIAGIRNGR
jgi:hypothetical protein